MKENWKYKGENSESERRNSRPVNCYHLFIVKVKTVKVKKVKIKGGTAIRYICNFWYANIILYAGLKKTTPTALLTNIMISGTRVKMKVIVKG